MRHNPSHPGEIIKFDCIEAVNLTVTAVAEGLGVSRKTLSALINGKSGVSPEMAIRLEKAGWSTAEVWLNMQLNYDLWNARQRTKQLKVKKLAVKAIQV